jgi:predicted AAA+ superfamily ATPase
VGTIDGREVDFVVEHPGGRQYIQVTQSLNDESVLARELAPLRAINDFHSRMILTADPVSETTFDGIPAVNIHNWLLEAPITYAP